MKLYVSRQRDGKYMLTYTPPVIQEVGNSGEQDVYVGYGDPVGWRGLCSWFIEKLWGIKDLEFGKFVRVKVKGEVLEDE